MGSRHSTSRASFWPQIPLEHHESTAVPYIHGAVVYTVTYYNEDHSKRAPIDCFPRVHSYRVVQRWSQIPFRSREGRASVSRGGGSKCLLACRS